MTSLRYNRRVLVLPVLLAALAAPDAGVLLARPVQVSADSLEVRGKEHKALYTGHAKVVRDTTTLTCEQLEVLSGPKQEVTRLLAHRDVVAVDGERWARGDEADFDNLTGVLVVTGNPQARQGKREVFGEKVTFTQGTDVLVVTKARTRAEENAKAIAVDADLLTLENAVNTATWTGHVRARRGPTLLLAPRLVAHYDDAGTITRLEAHGGVEAFEGDRWAKGKDATYEASTGVLVVTGQPEARQGKTHLKGTRVTFTTGKDVIDVENATTVIDVEKKKGAK